jgi:hypothetical protein
MTRPAISATAATAAAAALAASPPWGVDVVLMRRVVARWRAFVEGRQAACPLLDVLEKLPDLFKEVLERLDPTDRTMLAQAGNTCRAAVLASGLPRVPKTPVVRLRRSEFCTSVERLTWAKANGLPWNEGTCAYIARVGHLDVLQWARVRGCPWARAYTRPPFSST